MSQEKENRSVSVMLNKSSYHSKKLNKDVEIYQGTMLHKGEVINLQLNPVKQKGKSGEFLWLSATVFEKRRNEL